MMQIVLSALWVPAFILYGYPVMYLFIPRWLLKEKYLEFAAVLLLWAIAGYFFNYLFRSWVLFPVSDTVGYKSGAKNPWAANSYLSMNVMAGFGSMIVLFKYWMRKQKAFLLAQNEKTNAELQLLKAQLHPHFLFNTLNNLYSLVYEKSDRAPDMLLRLSGLLSYVLYECKSDKVDLVKEVSVMKDYVALEQERYGGRLEMSFVTNGDMSGVQITPLLLQPFIENAFKHGTAEQLGKVWMSIEFSFRNGQLFFSIINSFDNESQQQINGKRIGIMNVCKRLDLLYHGKYKLDFGKQGDIYAVSLSIDLQKQTASPINNLSFSESNQLVHEDPMFTGR